MFAKHKLGAACLQDYKGINKGAIVPTVNELYAEVEEWRKTNEWAELPDSFGVAVPTDEEQEAARAAAYADALTGSDRLFQSYQAALATDSADADSKKDAWLARRAEIQAEYPLTGE